MSVRVPIQGPRRSTDGIQAKDWLSDTAGVGQGGQRWWGKVMGNVCFLWKTAER